MKVQNTSLNTGEPVKADTFKHFTDSDVYNERIITDRSELIQAPTDWQKRGLQETSSGYGARLNTGLKIYFNGKAYRLYCTCYGNAGSVWFKVRGRTIYVS